MKYKFEHFKFTKQSKRSFPYGWAAGGERLKEAISYSHLCPHNQMEDKITIDKIESLDSKNASYETFKLYTFASALVNNLDYDNLVSKLIKLDPETHSEFFLFKDDDIWWFEGNVNYLLDCFKRNDLKEIWNNTSHQTMSSKLPLVSINEHVTSASFLKKGKDTTSKSI